MKKSPSKKLHLDVETIRNLTTHELAQVGGGSNISLSGTSVISVSSGTSVISRNPSGGITSISGR